MPTDKKISALTDGGQFQPTDQFPVDRSGSNFRVQIPNGGLPAINDAFIVVLSTSDPAANGLALLAAYTAAKALTPNGNALSATNRAAVIVPPGKYTLVTALTLDTQFVDILGATDQPKEVLITSAITTASSGTIVQLNGTDDVVIRGVTIQNTGSTRSANDPTDAAAWHFFTAMAATKVINCIFDDGGGISWGMTQGTPNYGTYINCVGGDKTFGGSSGGDARGTYTGCTGGDNAFAGDATVKTSARYESCVGGDYSFGNAVEGGSIFSNCVGGTWAFGRGVFIGTAINCRTTGQNGFGKGGFAGVAINCEVTGNEGFGGNGSTSQGLCINCRANAGSFGGSAGTFSGQAYGCFGGDVSFGGGAGVFSGHAVNCTGGEGSFGAVAGTFSGVMDGCVLARYANGYPFAFTPWANEWAPAVFTGTIIGVTFAPTGASANAVNLPDNSGGFAGGTFQYCTLTGNGGFDIAIQSGSRDAIMDFCNYDSQNCSPGFTDVGTACLGNLRIQGGAMLFGLLSAAASLDFSSISAGASADLTITVTGAAVGNNVILGLPAAPAAGIIFQAFVSGADTVTVRATNITLVSVDPASASYRVSVLKIS
jgi:hypothetical protein